MTHRTLSTLVGGLLLGATTGAAQLNPGQRVDSLFATWNNAQSPGCAVGVIQDGRWVHQAGYGMANLAAGTTITPETRFYLASVSKQFAAASIALAARQGKMSLDDPIRKWIPEFPEYGRGVTIRHLVHHTGGLRDYLVLLALNGRLAEAHSDDDVLALVIRQGGLDFEPGAEYSYSNSGYFLLSVIIKRATGMSLRAFADQQLFRPLGMKSSYFYDDHTAPHAPGPMAMGYESRNGRLEPALYPNFEQVADGGLYSTLNDLLAWDQNFYQPMVGDRAFLDLIQTPGRLSNGKALDYAFALMVRDYGGLRTVVHSGGFMGYRTIILRFPEQRWSAVMLCNLGTISPEALSLRIADIYLAEALDRSQDELAGEYWSKELDATWRLTTRGGALILTPDRGNEVRLMSQGNGKYGHTGGLGPATLTFQRESGRVTGFSIDAGRARGIRFVKR